MHATSNRMLLGYKEEGENSEFLPVTSSVLANFQGSVFVSGELEFDPRSALSAQIRMSIERCEACRC
jgi:hypothetical protein